MQTNAAQRIDDDTRPAVVEDGWEETTREWFAANVYTQNVVVPWSQIEFRDRYAHSVFETRYGRVVGKTVSDSHGVEATRYFKPSAV